MNFTELLILARILRSGTYFSNHTISRFSSQNNHRRSTWNIYKIFPNTKPIKTRSANEETDQYMCQTFRWNTYHKSPKIHDPKTGNDFHLWNSRPVHKSFISWYDEELYSHVPSHHLLMDSYSPHLPPRKP